MVIDLNDLALFHQVVRAGSFAEASRRLGVPSNTLSRRIGEFEGVLNARLLRRTTRQMVLTELGQALFERSAGPVDEALSIVADIRDTSSDPSGSVRIAATADFFEFVPMDWVTSFLAAHPKVRLDFILSDDHVDLIANGIDLAFRGGDLKDSSLIARRLFASPQLFAASPVYLRERGTPRTLQDLAGHDCITSGKPGRTVWRVNGPAGLEAVSVKGRFGGNTAKSQVKAAVAGLGLCMCPQPLIAPCLEDGSLVAVLTDLPQAVIDLYVVYPNRKHASQAASAFLEMALLRLAASKPT